MRRIKKLLLMALLAVALLPSNAYASTMVGAYSAGYDADDVATEYLGFDTYMTLDQGLKTVIHNSSTSGGSGTTANPNYPYYAAFRNSLSSAFNYLPGSGNTWYSSYNGFGFADAVDKARADLAKAFRWWETNKEGIENDPGGNDGTVVEGDYTLISVTAWSNSIPSNKSGVTSIGVLSTQYQELRNYAAANGLKIIAYANANGAFVRTLPAGAGVFWDETSRRDTSKYVCVVGITNADLNGTTSIGQKAISGSGTVQNGVWYINGTVANGDINFQWLRYGDAVGYDRYQKIAAEIYYKNENVIGGPVTPPYEPVEPDPLPPRNPETPSDPVIPDPPETDNPVPSPDIDWGDTHITNINVTQTDPDYQPIINAISVVNQTLQQTQNLILALQNNMKIGFEELDNQIYNNFQALLAQNDSWWNWLHDAWESGAQQLELWGDWLNSTIEEIRDDFEGFENNLITWLQMIYNKIASGGGPTSKPDPIQDDGGFWDWWANIVDKILGMLPEAVTDFLSQLDRLKGVFPFSIPWDVSFILGLFSQPPETPVFDIDMDTHYWQWDAHIDLHQWDNAATIFRRCVLLVFAMQLAMWTPDVIRNLVDI